jgi:hypothetical protein
MTEQYKAILLNRIERTRRTPNWMFVAALALYALAMIVLASMVIAIQ